MRAALASLLHRAAEALDRSDPSSRNASRARHPASGGPAPTASPAAPGALDTTRTLPHGLRLIGSASQPRYEAQFQHRGHGASEGDPAL